MYSWFDDNALKGNIISLFKWIGSVISSDFKCKIYIKIWYNEHEKQNMCSVRNLISWFSSYWRNFLIHNNIKQTEKIRKCRHFNPGFDGSHCTNKNLFYLEWNRMRVGCYFTMYSNFFPCIHLFKPFQGYLNIGYNISRDI